MWTETLQPRGSRSLSQNLRFRFILKPSLRTGSRENRKKFGERSEPTSVKLTEEFGERNARGGAGGL